MKYHYKDLGLSNTKEMFEKANKEGYSVPAFNFNNLEQIQGIIEAMCGNRITCYFTGIKRSKKLYRKRNGAFLSTGSSSLCKIERF